jgi:hypothetical protein
MWNNEGGGLSSLFAPAVDINRQNLFAAITEIEKLADWIDTRGDKIWEWRTKQPATGQR